MSASFDTICRGPLLSREAARRVFASPGLPIKATPQEALFQTLNDVTSDLLRHASTAYASIASLEAASRAFQIFRDFLDNNPLLAYPPPRPAPGYLSNQGHWFGTELRAAKEAKRGRGRPGNQFFAYAVPNLMALYAIAYEREPNPGNELAPGPTVRFVQSYAAETFTAIQGAKFEPESEWLMVQNVWRFPSKLQPAFRKRRLAREPKSEASRESDLPEFLAEYASSDWDLVAHAFIQHGGQNPFKPSRSKGSVDSK